MNKKRRKAIRDIIADLTENKEARNKLEEVLWEEEEAFDNMPENLQYSMRGEDSQEAISTMEEAIELIDEEKYQEAAELLEEVAY